MMCKKNKNWTISPSCGIKPNSEHHFDKGMWQAYVNSIEDAKPTHRNVGNFLIRDPTVQANSQRRF